MKDRQGIKGVVTITKKDTKTGETLSVYRDSNVVTMAGMEAMIYSFTSQDDTYIDSLHLGDDVGSGSKMFPESPNDNIQASNQSVLFSVSGNSMPINYVAQNRFIAEVVLDGQSFMNAFPSEVSVDITSATLRFNDGTAFAYKRFPAITMSRFVTVEIEWEVTFTNA